MKDVHQVKFDNTAKVVNITRPGNNRCIKIGKKSLTAKIK